MRLGRRLPMRQFFLVTGGLLYYLAVVFAGKGVAELQGAGVVPTTLGAVGAAHRRRSGSFPPSRRWPRRRCCCSAPSMRPHRHAPRPRPTEAAIEDRRRARGANSNRADVARRSTSMSRALLVSPSRSRCHPARRTPRCSTRSDEALHLAFPDADRIEARDFFLTAGATRRRSRSAPSRSSTPICSPSTSASRTATRCMGYAIFDTHIVRTLPETFLVVLTPQGNVAATHLLAFYEPPEYAPPARWLEQFHDATLTDDLRVGRGIVAITGSTLTSEAVTGGIRRALAIYNVASEGLVSDALRRHRRVDAQPPAPGDRVVLPRLHADPVGDQRRPLLLQDEPHAELGDRVLPRQRGEVPASRARCRACSRPCTSTHSPWASC